MEVGLKQKKAIALSHKKEIEAGERFEFGKNWKRFLELLDDERITAAESSLRDMLEVRDLSGASFLDIGSGSGLFSLAARKLGARVVSFDYDSESVACTRELKQRYFLHDERWAVDQGSVLDAGYVGSLGKFDVVYSWGVLHHTGDMWKALTNADSAVANGGKLFIALYNDTGSQSKRWEWIKRTYCKLPAPLKTPFAAIAIMPDESKRLISYLLKGRPAEYLRYWKDYRNDRGMNRWHDIIDWVGGYPYEVAGPSAVFDFFRSRGYRLTRLRCDRVGLGCNEFVFVKDR
jgi:2-polyprenyl-6-hydroxyphenyl methylase/3-demethylubiquinone-9 3-methyltransferase